jgi:hypothetical protein
MKITKEVKNQIKEWLDNYARSYYDTRHRNATDAWANNIKIAVKENTIYAKIHFIEYDVGGGGSKESWDGTWDLKGVLGELKIA